MLVVLCQYWTLFSARFHGLSYTVLLSASASFRALVCLAFCQCKFTSIGSHCFAFANARHRKFGFSLEEMEDSLSAHSFILSLCLSVTKKHLLVYFSSIYLSVLDICSAFFLQYIFLFKGVSCGSYSVSQLSLVQCNLSTRFGILNDQNALCLVFPFTACFMQ